MGAETIGCSPASCDARTPTSPAVSPRERDRETPRSSDPNIALLEANRTRAPETGPVVAVPKTETAATASARETRDENPPQPRALAREISEKPRASFETSRPERNAGVKPSNEVTAYKGDANIELWLRERGKKEQGRRLLKIRRASRELDWILARRRLQIAKCKREVKNDKAEKAAVAQAKREEMEKLAVAPAKARRESEDAARDVELPKTVASEAEPSEPLGMEKSAEDENPARLGRRRTDAQCKMSVPRNAPRRGSVLDLLGEDRRRSTIHRGRLLEVLDATTRLECAETLHPPKTQPREPSRPREPRVETMSVWVGPGRFVTMRVEMPPAALTITHPVGRDSDPVGFRDEHFDARRRRSSSFSLSARLKTATRRSARKSNEAPL